MSGKWPPILSFGAGVNSVALAILAINDGWCGEIVFADTGCEWPETYCYVDYFEGAWLKPRGMAVSRISQQHYNAGLLLLEYCEMRHIVPLAAMRWCTVEFKVRPLADYQAGRSCMIGIAADERHRQPQAIRPLVDLGIGRKECIAIIQRAGLDVPQKSGCFICPFQRDAQWRTLWKRHPELFERAAQLEENATRNARQNGKRTANYVLDPGGKTTLRQRQLAYESQVALPGIDMDELLAFKPCVCGL